MTFGQRLITARENNGYSQRGLAEALGITPTRLNYWEKDKRQPDVPMIKRLAETLGISADYLIGNNNKIAPDITPEAHKIAKSYDRLDEWGQKVVRDVIDDEQARMTATASLAHKRNVIPLRLSLQPVSAGTGAYLGPEEFETIYVEKNDLTSRAAFAVRVQGNSMEPPYHDGDILLVEGAEDIPIGEVGVFTVCGEGFVKERDESVLHSLNPDYGDIDLTEDSRCNGLVIGTLDPDWIR